MIKTKISNIIFIILFISMLFIPILLINRDENAISLTENRALNKLPDFFDDSGKFIKSSLSQIEPWINDNIGFRDFFSQANIALEYTSFGQSGQSNVIRGKNDWLYYTSQKILEDYQNINLPNEEKLKQYANKYIKAYEHSKIKNIPFIGYLALDKKTIYPENYPDAIKKVSNISKRDLLETYINENTNMNFLIPYDQLISAKNNGETVYSERIDNAHWNLMGEFVGYQVLMEEVKKSFQDINILDKDDFNISRKEFTVPYYKFLTISELGYIFDENFENSSYIDNNIFDENFPHIQYKNDAGLVVNRHINPNNQNAPRALIMGDSYIYQKMLSFFLTNSFSEIIFIHNSNIENVESYIDAVNPDITIIQFVERSLFVD
ncbi:MAG: hypothetical protein ACRCZK_05425 [Oscillospiraceae bacterium]